jgi:hypothetical protein
MGHADAGRAQPGERSAKQIGANPAALMSRRDDHRRNAPSQVHRDEPGRPPAVYREQAVAHHVDSPRQQRPSRLQRS